MEMQGRKANAKLFALSVFICVYLWQTAFLRVLRASAVNPLSLPVS